MMLFKLPTQIHTFAEFKCFAEAFALGEGDLVLTHQFLYEPFMKALELKADYIMQETYGAGEPSDEMIDRVMADVGGKPYKRIIAIGGGTVIDIAKLLIFEASGDTLSMFERRIPLIKDKQLIVVPTTCGTGSEVTNLSIVEIKSKQTKMGLGLDDMYPDAAVLVPELIKGLPYSFFIYSSIDALIHAIESYVSPNANDYTRMFSMKSAEMILGGYLELIEKGPEHRLAIMEQFVVGSNYAGIAFGNAGVGAVHALSYPLGGTYHVPHGEANYLFFTEVFASYTRLEPQGRIKELNARLADILKERPETIFASIEALLNKLLVRRPLREYGVRAEELPGLRDSVIGTQQRLLSQSYVQLSREEILNIYERLY